MNIKRGHIYIADLDPRFGTEPGKQRPVLVLQTDIINSRHTSTIVCLLTSKITTDATHLRVLLKKGEAGLTKDSDIMMDQIRSVDNTRIKKEIGTISSQKMKSIEEKLKIVFDLP